jgi:hypothetical protein
MLRLLVQSLPEQNVIPALLFIFTFQAKGVALRTDHLLLQQSVFLDSLGNRRRKFHLLILLLGQNTVASVQKPGDGSIQRGKLAVLKAQGKRVV